MRSKQPRSINIPAKRWQLQTAKAKFSELFRRARSEGPQWVTRQDKEAVVVVAAEEFKRMRAMTQKHKNLAEFLAESPLAKFGVDLARQKDYGRDIDL